jgi:hypothetical protein
MEASFTREGEHVDLLIDEYRSLLDNRSSLNNPARFDERKSVEAILRSADWTLSGASELLALAEDYGAFMLRNALALAVVLGREDGSRGF